MREDTLKKYLILLIITSLFIARCSTSHAAPVYGTHMPEGRRWIWGLEGNFIVDRNLDNDEGGVEVNKCFLAGSYGIFPWLSFDGKIGIGSVDWDRGKGDDLNYAANFAGGYGFRIKGYENEKWSIKSVAGFQHISVHPAPKNQGGDKNESIIDEWQGSLVVSKDAGNFVPYMGTRYGTLDFIRRTNEVDRKRIKSEKNFGVIVGLDYYLDKKTKLNLEAAFLDGGELAMGVSYDF